MKTRDMEKQRKILKEGQRSPFLDCLRNAIKEVNMDPANLELGAHKRTTSEVRVEYNVGR